MSHPHKLHTLHRRIGSFVKLIDVRVLRDNLMILADAVNIQKMTPQIDIGFFAFYKDVDLSLSVIH